MTDLDLLREYEPIVRYTQGELFFPCAVDEYIARASLLPRTTDRSAPAIVPAGELTLERLAAEGDADPSRMLCLRFVQERLRGKAYRQWLRRPGRPEFHTSGRLARVGLFPRVVDSLFSLSLLLRGTVPGGTTAAAEQQYEQMQRECPDRVYYGRVLRQNGYVVLNYLFFFAMNDWRSSFAGVNDHEADWEQIFVYLAEQQDAPPEPAWVAYASHDFHGDDLRRRWDDPEVTRAGTHPVVYAGAGSHASYFKPGEYLTSVELRPLAPLLRAVQVVRRIWRDVLRQGDPTDLVSQVEGLLRIPFVDYARGDGRAIGPDQPDTWTPVLVDESTPWVEHYRGLWGLDTRDPLSGELAPSGPKYQRDGSVRQSWYDPLGWAGLGKVAPAPEAMPELRARITEIEAEIAETDAALATLAESLPRLDLEVQALHDIQHLRRLQQERGRELATRETERGALEARRVELAETLAACRRALTRLEAGDPGDPRAHLHHTHEPESEREIRRGKLAEVWAGISIGLLLLGGVAVMLFDLDNWLTALLLLIGGVVVVENILHRTLERLLLNATIVLAIASSAVLIYEFYWELALIGVVAIALVILADNIREIRRF